MTNIYVGNLDFSTHEDQLQTLFAAYGAVKTVTTVNDRDTGQPRGFAFVEMTNGREARDAIRTLNGFQYSSADNVRALHVPFTTCSHPLEISNPAIAELCCPGARSLRIGVS